VQVHPVPLSPVTVKPVGGVSVTVTVEPSVGPTVAADEFDTVTVYVSPVSPWRKLPVCDFVIDRTGFCTIVVGSLTLAHGEPTQPPPTTDAWFVSDDAALLATLTVTVIAGYDEPAASASERVHVFVDTEHVHPVPLSPVKVKPVGGVSVTVTVEPSVGPTVAADEFDTVTVYVSPVSPWRKLPVCVFVIERTGFCTIVVGSLTLAHGEPTQPPPTTDAWFVNEDAALLATLTVTVIAGYEEPAASASDRVHVSVPTVQVHPVPLSPVTVSPVGGASVTVTVDPSVGPTVAADEFDTVTVY
jgi:hypothetical protein